MSCGKRYGDRRFLKPRVIPVDSDGKRCGTGCRTILILASLHTHTRTFPNVLITPHQGFFTQDALYALADTTLTSIGAWARGEQPKPTLIYKGQPVKGINLCSGGKNVKVGREKMEAEAEKEEGK